MHICQREVNQLQVPKKVAANLLSVVTCWNSTQMSGLCYGPHRLFEMVGILANDRSKKYKRFRNISNWEPGIQMESGPHSGYLS